MLRAAKKYYVVCTCTCRNTHVYTGSIGGLLANTVHCIVTKLEVTVSVLLRHEVKGLTNKLYTYALEVKGLTNKLYTYALAWKKTGLHAKFQVHRCFDMDLVCIVMYCQDTKERG